MARRALTDEETALLVASDALEPNIDDIPEAPVENWRFARRGSLERLRKEAISVRLDLDVLTWLRARGPGYQTEINRILRERMMAEAGAGRP